MPEGVIFNEPKLTPEERYGLKRPVSRMADLVIKYSRGYVKNEKGANLALLGFVALAVIISLFLVFSRGGRDTSSQEEIERLMREAPPPKLVEPELIR